MNEQNLKIPTSDEARELGRRGGIASGEARREKKRIADALRAVLSEDAGNGLTRREAIVVKVLKRLYDEGDIYQLKVLAEILGETEQNININSSERPLTPDEAKRMIAEYNAKYGDNGK